MKAATDIAYSAETGVVVGSFHGAVYIARAILAERQRFVAEFDGAADAGIDAAVAAERERCAGLARKEADRNRGYCDARHNAAQSIEEDIRGGLQP
ncbi:hypothetical protein EN742_33430 [Mesorhizobium sp. M4A.F.Ca.ET.020.02.1.1]|uniref:hypothetical protein n=1 Tax=Mesorhizobium sp. M4A.F.Ca.ET.020.02.1.1 TaxID=2496652 RepID=UPI000FD514AF|nr:hypothetical protein [Mesorhizobium sp. M4A.F.Ca.ET.020.02.1.1]RVD32017.1 hypothetical protein EN742_33430 [Mesorhizobium sp. M4A.F.Ca.ET.020.02.1.1]